MVRFARSDLLAYILGDCPQELRQQIEAEKARDPELQADLAFLAKVDFCFKQADFPHTLSISSVRQQPRRLSMILVLVFVAGLLFQRYIIDEFSTGTAQIEVSMPLELHSKTFYANM